MNDLTGQRIAHYEVLELLGTGGMGVVYKARDTILNRTVAMKFLPHSHSPADEDKKRFINEARAVSSLDHSNICSIYEINETSDGKLFIVMPAYEGEPLSEKIMRGFLSVEESVEIAIQIAEGLQAAHEMGIVHRDIKSSNIFITRKSQVKILDFGLAKTAAVTMLTKTGKTVGTVPYMSPEQARGEKIDHRTDIWSLAIVLYEMIAGKLPFASEYSEAVVYSILNEEPTPLTSLRSNVSTELEQTVNRALMKKPEDRYETVGEFIHALKRLSVSPETRPRQYKSVFTSLVTQPRIGVPILVTLLILILLTVPNFRNSLFSILSYEGLPDEIHLAVLPFLNVGNNPENQAFCDGLMETLASTITQLEIVHGSLWVVPTIDIRGENVGSVEEARRLLGVTLVLTGSVHRIDDAIHITLNLINSSTRRQLRSWYTESDIQNLTALQNDMIIQVALMLELELGPLDLERIKRETSVKPEAFELYLQARGYLQRYDNVENISQAITLFTSAISMDPDFSLAYAGLGEAHWRMYEETRDHHLIEQAIRDCLRSLELNNQNASTHITLGIIRHGTGEYKHAIESFQRAIEIDHVNSEAHRELARTFEALGMFDEAEQTFLRSISLRPNYWAGYNSLGGLYYRHNRYREAAEQFQRVIELTPDNARGYSNLGAMYHYLNQLDTAEKYYRQAIEITPDFGAVSNLATLYFSDGRYDEAVSMYELLLEFNDKDYRVWGNLASAYYWGRSEKEMAEKTYRKAIEIAEETIVTNPQDARAIVSLAGYLAMIHDRERAFAYLHNALTIAQNDAWIMYNAGTTYERLGDREHALHWIEQALRRGYSKSDVLSYPGLHELVTDGRFQKILRDTPD
jgi:serine/threonine protein kinase/tetratricopeptide (TPR) repeat protein